MIVIVKRWLGGIGRRLGIESHEQRLLVLMGALVATLFCAYTIAKILRDALFLSEFGALALPYAYIGVAVAAAGFVWLESIVARRFTDVGATRFNQYAAIGFSILAAITLPHARHWTIAAFYIWTGSQAMMLLPHFWGLALDVWDSRRARSIFPLFGGCGLLGGLAGGAFAAWSTPLLKHVGLMWTMSGLLVASYGLTRIVERNRALRPAPLEASTKTSRWGAILRSPYIKTLTIALALSVVVSTLVDFQFKLYIQSVYPDQHSLTQFFGKFYVGLNALSLLFQFSVAGLILRRLGLGAATALQPITAVAFMSWIVLSPIWLVIVAMRWIQGIVFGTLGKSSAEIYYTAIHPRERRRIKPAIDTLVERWSDAAAGLLLIVVLHTVGVRTSVIAVVTIALSVAWVAVLIVLNRQYGDAFQQTLSSRWIEPEATPDAVRTPSARRALMEALRADDEQRIVFALTLSRAVRDRGVASAVRGCLRHSSPAVRTAAVDAMRAMRLSDPEKLIEGFMQESEETLRRAAVGYLLAQSPHATTFARLILDGEEVAVRQYLLDALFERPYEAPDAITPAWIDARIAAGSREDLLLAARAAGVLSGTASVRFLRTLLANPDLDVKRVALVSARRRPHRELIEVLLPLFLIPDLSHEAREALAAIGDPAVTKLEPLLQGAGGAWAQALAARTLARMATPRAVKALIVLARTGDPRLRHFGLEGLSRIRANRGRPVLPRATVHKLFLRELASVRLNREASQGIAAHAAAEVRLFASSLEEQAEWGLERGLRALACWYEAKPLAGAFERLRSREPQAAAPALEYLSHVLPRAVFRPVSRVFEGTVPEEVTVEEAAGRDDVAEPIRAAWKWGDDWLRACAVRASRFSPSLDPSLFESGGFKDPLVSAELAVLAKEIMRETNRRPAAEEPIVPTSVPC